jgi:surface polysaccharide O-acyltransferase-like enzyme
MSASREVWLDYLRSFVTLLVVAHHAALAYPTFAYFNPDSYIYSTAPVVDASRWIGMDRLIGFNDLFFMALMFLISGLFVHRSLERKGIKAFLADRLIRLGIPFLVAELLLIPLAYLPSFFLATPHHSTFVMDYLFNQQWPVGPPWFIWLLLVFDGVAVLIFARRRSFFPRLGSWLAGVSKRPILFCMTLYGLVALSLIPLSLWVGQYKWVGIGPFDFQLNRFFFYLLFYLLGVGLGSVDWQQYLFRQGRLLGQDWSVWLLFSLLAYGLFVLVSGWGAGWVKQGKLNSLEGYFFYDLAFVISCMASIGACLSFFKQRMTRPNPVWSDLSANAYGIFVVHYGFVTWLQFGLLGVEMPVVVKCMLVFTGALLLSWLTSRIARRSTIVARVL